MCIRYLKSSVTLVVGAEIQAGAVSPRAPCFLTSPHPWRWLTWIAASASKNK